MMIHRETTTQFILFLSLCLGLTTPSANAYIRTLPPSLLPEILSEEMPTAMRQVEFSADDFEIEWVGPAIPDTTLRIGKNSIEWVRIAESLSLPRAVLTVDAPGAESGSLKSAGYTRAFTGSHGEIPVALLSGDSNSHEIRALRAGKVLEGKVRFRFRPKSPEHAGVWIDNSCSSYWVKAEDIQLPAHSWAYVGCRYVWQEGPDHPVSSLEAVVVWDHVGQKIEVSKIPVTSGPDYAFPFRAGGEPDHMVLSAKDLDGNTGHFTLRWKIPVQAHYGAFAMQLGLSTFAMAGDGQSTNSIAPTVRITAIYTLNELIRLYGMAYTSVHPQNYSDVGLYGQILDFTALDKRLNFRLILGAHVLMFRPATSFYAAFNANQGAEFTYRDAFKRGHDIRVGFFYLPLLSGQSYLATWLRWGSPRLYVEGTYITWTQNANSSTQTFTSYGVNVGLPIGAFF